MFLIKFPIQERSGKMKPMFEKLLLLRAKLLTLILLLLQWALVAT